MRVIFVNNSHPDIKHVSGMRFGCFAEAMAERGHHVVLLTSTLPDDDSTESVDRILIRLNAHDWSKPFHLACCPLKNKLLELARTNAVSKPIRKAITLWSFVAKSGVHYDWVDATKPYWKPLVEIFKPNIIWATFGNTSNLHIAKSLARRARCPWVADFKDNIDLYIPKLLRTFFRINFSTTNYLTANAECNAAIASHFFGKPCDVVYSGVSDAFANAISEKHASGVFRLMLVGSIYDRTLLKEFLSGITKWLGRLNARDLEEVEFGYAGSSHKLVRDALDELHFQARSTCYDYLPLKELAAICKGASANCYIRFKHEFHHKTLELASLGIPVLSFPGESWEAVGLTRRLGAQLLTPTTEGELVSVLNQLHNAWRVGGISHSTVNPKAVSWDAFARDLEVCFEHALQRHQRIIASKTRSNRESKRLLFN